ncbi:galactokinase [Dyadobacter subterraneus]|uniref:Galactokinase n=1 Tax=Dyadobacter subterraneus TaxID=2773304 RepID=A0ABR9W529_9BACT|nr:galactokinase family protein [Dyadobacter subterraneus]MBE9460560.1 galactokinase [Dyadobacter subterraneus]
MENIDFEATVKSIKHAGKFFSPDFPVHISRAPGRLDLMGGNDDYTGGLVFESTIKEATYAAAQLREDGLVVLRNKTVTDAGWQGEIIVNLEDLSDENHVKAMVNRSSSVRWTAYVLGNLHYLKKKFGISKGIQLYMESSVPLNRGVSSSAAIEVAVMKSSAAAYGIDLSGVELALACQWVENVIADSACGIMDQIAVVTGKKGHVMPLVCQPCIPEPLITLPDELQVWGIDSGVSHQVSGIEYEAARAAAFMGYKMVCDFEGVEIKLDTSSDISRYTDHVWNGYLANIPRSVFYQKYEKRLPETIRRNQYLEKYQIHVDPFTPLKDEVNYNVRANTRYAVEENQRVQLFSELSRGASVSPSERAFGLMGDLMYQSHYAYNECGLGAEATDFLVNVCRKEGAENGIYGAKITGGGAGGTVAILGKKSAGPTIERIFKTYAEAKLGEPYLFEGSSDGADSYGIVTI